MNSARYSAADDSLIIIIDGKTYAIPVQPSWHGIGQFAMIGITSTANEMHGLWLPADVREQIAAILKEHAF